MPHGSNLALSLRLAAAALLATALIAPVAVRADADLTSSDPAAGASVPGPYTGQVTLGFSATLGSGSHAELLDGSGATVADATVSGDSMVFAPAAPLAPGAYKVQWTSVAADRHVARGTFGFTVLEPTPPPATPTPGPATPSATPSSAPSQPPSAAPASPSPTAGASASPEPGPGEAGAADVLIPVGAALVMVVVAGALLLRRGRSPGA